MIKNIEYYISALVIYFKIRNTSHWYRESTNEWVYEIDVYLDEEYGATSRFPSKFFILTYFVWLRYFWSDVRDIKETIKIF